MFCPVVLPVTLLNGIFIGFFEGFGHRPNPGHHKTRSFIGISAYHETSISNRGPIFLTYRMIDTLFSRTPVFLQFIGLSTPEKPNFPKTLQKYFRPPAEFH
jgi:hypothetical protein